MRSLPQALLWETASHGRWTLPGCFLLAISLPLLVYGALSGISIDPKSQEFLALQVGLVSVVIVQLTMGMAVAQGPFARLFPLPISTNSIVAWHVFSGAFIVAFETAAAAWLFNSLFHVDWPILGAALFSSAAWAALQVIMNATRLQSLPVIFMALTPAVLLCFWFNTRYGAWMSPPKHNWSQLTTIEVGTLLSAFAICYALITYSVGIARCGERIRTLGVSDWLDRQWETYSQSRSAPPRFQTALAAQAWYNWKQKGRILPLLTLVVLFCFVTVGFVAWFLQLSSLQSIYDGILVLGCLVSILACGAGLLFGLEIEPKTSGQRDFQLSESVAESNLESGMGDFLCSRPLSSKDFANSLLRTAARSAILAWAMWFAVFGCCLLLIWFSNQFPDSLMPKSTGLLYLQLTILGPWIVFANLGAIGVSGRGAVAFFALVTFSVTYCVFLGSLNFTTSVHVSRQVHSICTTIAAVAIAVATVWAFTRAYKAGYVQSSTCAAALLGSIAMMIVAWLLRPESTPFVFYPMAVIVACLVVFPIAAMPLAIAWNRHK